MSSITEKILSKIKDNNIVPKPRWQFLLKNWIIWALATLTILIGSLSFSVMLFNIVNNDWEVIKYINRSPFQHALDTLPYIWIILLIIFIFLAFYTARHSKGAYRYKGYLLVTISILMSLGLGSIFYGFGVAPRIHIFSQNLPLFHNLIHNRDDIWMEAENGLLAGEITQELSGNGMFELVDFNGNTWIVRPTDNFIAPPMKLQLQVGIVIRMVGEIEDENIFGVNMIMPYHVGPGMFKGNFQNRNNHGTPQLPMRFPIK